MSWRCPAPTARRSSPPPTSPPPGDWSWHSRCLLCKARPWTESGRAMPLRSRPYRPPTAWSGSRRRCCPDRAAHRPWRPPLSRSAPPRRRAADPWCRPLPDDQHGRSARSRGPRHGDAPPRRGPSRPAGRWRRGKASCGPWPRPGRPSVRRGRRTRRAYPAGIPPAPRRTPRPAPSAAPPRGGCGRFRGAHRPARRTSRSRVPRSGSPDRRPRRSHAAWPATR